MPHSDIVHESYKHNRVYEYVVMCMSNWEYVVWWFIKNMPLKWVVFICVSLCYHSRRFLRSAGGKCQSAYFTKIVLQRNKWKSLRYRWSIEENRKGSQYLWVVSIAWRKRIKFSCLRPFTTSISLGKNFLR